MGSGRRMQVAAAAVVVGALMLAAVVTCEESGPAPPEHSVEAVAARAGGAAAAPDEATRRPRRVRTDARVARGEETPPSALPESPPASDVVAERPPHTVNVHVQDARGASVVHANVEVWAGVGTSGGGGSSVTEWPDTLGGHWSAKPAGPLASERTDTTGNISVVIPRPDSITVRVARDDLIGEAVYVAISDPDTTSVEVTVSPAFRLSGVVRFVDGAPVGGASVYLQWNHGHGHPKNLHSVPTDSEGAFEFPVTALPESLELRVYAIGGGAPGGAVTQIARVGRIADVEVTLERATFVRGRCVDSDGQPIAGVRVRGILPGTGEITMTGGDGRFGIPVPGSGGGLVFWKAGLVQTGLRDLRGPPEGVDIGDVLIPKGGVMAGRIVDTSDAPLAAAEVQIVEPVSEHAAYTGVTDAGGRFRGELIGPGAHTIAVRVPVASSSAACWFRFAPHFVGSERLVLVVPEGVWALIVVNASAPEASVALSGATVTIGPADASERTAVYRVFGEGLADRFRAQFPTSGRYELTILLADRATRITSFIDVTDAPGQIINVYSR